MYCFLESRLWVVCYRSTNHCEREAWNYNSYTRGPRVTYQLMVVENDFLLQFEIGVDRVLLVGAFVKFAVLIVLLVFELVVLVKLIVGRFIAVLLFHYLN